MLFRSVRNRHDALAGAALAVAASMLIAGVGPDGQMRQQRTGLIGVIGNWQPVEDQGQAFRVDGEQWSGRTPASQLETVGRSLFPDRTEHVASFVASGVAEGAFPLAVWSAVAEFKQGTVRVQFKLVGGRSDQNAGIVFGLQPDGEYLFMRYNTKDGNVAVWRYANGQRRVLIHGTNHAQLPLNTWHELTLTVTGSNVVGRVTGSTLTVEHTLDRPVSGRVGLWTKRDAITVFRGFRVSQ